MEEREARQRELAREQSLANIDQERAASFRRQNNLLLMMFDEMVKSKDPHHRGYLLQDLLNRLLDLHRIPVFHPFTRNDGGEQIDGAFRLDGWHYLVECRWRSKLGDVREIDGLLGQVRRSGRQTMGLFLSIMGLFLSINGWSENVVPLLKQNPDKSIILMHGHDLRTIMAQPLDLSTFLKAKLAALNLKAEPHLGVDGYELGRFARG